jgi:hypothetical protein
MRRIEFAGDLRASGRNRPELGRDGPSVGRPADHAPEFPDTL